MPLSVVLVDDDDGVRRLLGAALPRDLIEIVGAARNGAEAVGVVGDTHPDLVIMDLFMPAMDGAEATRRIKFEWPHVGVIGFTSGDGSAFNRLLRAGAAAVFEKANPYQLVEALLGYQERADIWNVQSIWKAPGPRARDRV